MKEDAKESAARLLAVSRETLERLEMFEALLRKWQPRLNLVSRHALDDLWMRHIADSGQLLRLASQDARIWADLGSGAGFPGAILGVMLRERAGACVHLIESDQKKCAFLAAVSRETEAPLIIHCQRIESALPRLAGVDVIVSRATASLPVLLNWSRATLEAGALGLFSKGKTYAAELTGYTPPDRIALRLEPSRTDSGAVIVVAQAVEPTAKNPSETQ